MNVTGIYLNFIVSSFNPARPAFNNNNNNYNNNNNTGNNNNNNNKSIYLYTI